MLKGDVTIAKASVQQGVSPEQVNAETLEHTTTKAMFAQTDNIAQKTTPTAKAMTEGKKLKNEDQPLKRKEQDIPQLKEAITSKLAILARDYPRQLLKKNQLIMIESALVTEMRNGGTPNLNFNGMEYRNGILLVVCLDEETRAWLEEAVSKITAIQDVTLRTCQWDEIPDIRVITVKLPRAVGEDKNTVMSLLEKQNQSLQPEKWLFLKCTDMINSIIFKLGIETTTLEAVKARGMCLSYLFSQIPCVLSRYTLLDLPFRYDNSMTESLENSYEHPSLVEYVLTKASNIKTEDNDLDQKDLVWPESSVYKCNAGIIIIDDE